MLTTISEWAQVTCQIPVLVESEGFDRADGSDAAINARPWYLYRHANEVKIQEIPSLYATTNREKSKLIDIIGEATAMLYTLDTACLKANHILGFYSRFVRWRNELPDVLKDLGSRKQPALPYVLSLWYVKALMLLLTALIL
jgi:hypothetical protein